LSALPGILGIHHLTAVSADAQRTVDFYTKQLGQRLIEQSVDLDDPTSYRLSFADEEHGPGVISFVVRPGAARGRFGIGGVHHLAYETDNRQTLRQWKRWLTDRGIPVSGPYDRVYFESIYFTDPDGLILEIATRGPGWTRDEPPDRLGAEVKLPPVAMTAGHRDEAAIAAETWPEPIAAPSPAMRLKRMHHITAIGSDASRTEAFFTGLLGLRTVKRTVNFDDPDSPHLYFGVGDGAPGTIITSFAYPHGTLRPARPGVGLTDHFALSVPGNDALAAWREHLLEQRVPVTEMRDHGSFHRFALRDPDGLLLEIASASPGYTSDGHPSELGRSLRLPPWLEPRREEIAAGLPPLSVPDPAGRT
jgi:glyoxalase family protein